MYQRKVTEQDFRMPEFRDARVEDYEFRDDGKLVRKDRWERAIHSIRFLVGNQKREFEIEEVVEAVRALAKDVDGWTSVDRTLTEDLPPTGTRLELRLVDGSILRNASCDQRTLSWQWNGAEPPLAVSDWRETPRAG